MEKCSVVKSLHSNVREWGGERRRPSAEAEESRASVTLQVGGLWLYPVLMRAAQPRISSSKSIKGANKCRAVTGLPRDHSRPRETRERGREWGRELKPRWWTLAGERERSWGPPVEDGRQIWADDEFCQVHSKHNTIIYCTDRRMKATAAAHGQKLWILVTQPKVYPRKLMLHYVCVTVKHTLTSRT